VQRRQIWLRFQKWGGLPHYHHLVEPLGYPPEVVSTARATADWLLGAVSGRREPFGTASAGWLDRLG
jgi:hypothetical protein